MSVSSRPGIKLTESPIFVLGAPRSGTSMMQWALRQHPDLWGGQESDFMVPLVEALGKIHAFGSRRGNLHWLSGQSVDEAEFIEYMGVGLNTLYTDRSGGLRWIEQTPQYTLHMDDMLALFPGAVFVMMLRDGRDVVESLKHFVNPVEHDEASRIWARFAKVGLDFTSGTHGDRVAVIRYEDAVQRTEETMSRLFSFLEIPEAGESVAWIRDRSPINSSFEGPSDEEGRTRWHAWTEDERRSFDYFAGDVLIEAGFEPDSAWVSS